MDHPKEGGVIGFEPKEVHVAITLPALRTERLAPKSERTWSSRLLTPWPDPVMDVDLIGAKLKVYVRVTFPNGEIREMNSEINGKSSSPYTRVLKITDQKP